MATDKLLTRTEKATGWIVFNNPERHNAISLEMWQGVGEALDAYEKDDAVRVVVVTGAGGRAFASGADISQFEKTRSNYEAQQAYSAATQASSRKLATFPKPTIAMIDGYCLGGGLGIAASCDLRICSDGSRFGLPAARLGLGYGIDGLAKLVALVGLGNAKEITFTARRYSAAEAKEMGLVNRVVPAGELAEAVEEIAATIADNAPLTIAAMKLALSELARDPADRDLEKCEAAVRRCFDSADYAEGRRAFMEKRKPVFVGR